jgi:hypothetical protein
VNLAVPKWFRGFAAGPRSAFGLMTERRAVQQSADTVRLHAFTFASNHFHLLVWAPTAHVSHSSRLM